MLDKKKKSVIVDYVLNRVVNLNKNFLMIFVGETGSGKSYSALRFAETLDPTFDISRVCFRAIDFMHLINEIVYEKQISKKGMVVMWDEFGVEHNAREFMSITNRVINYFFQTCRHLNLIFLMTVPVLSMIDVNTRKLSHAVAETVKIDFKKNKIRLKMKMTNTNALTGDIWFQYLRKKIGNKIAKTKYLQFGLPSEKLREDYEKKKTDFTKQLNKSIEFRLRKIYEREMPNIKQEPIDKFPELRNKKNEELKEIIDDMLRRKKLNT